MEICVIGAGYVGLVTATGLADFGNNVICIDKDKKKVANLNRGIIDFHELGLADLVRKNAKAKRLCFSSSSLRAIVNSDIIFVAVGTPPLASGAADLSAVDCVAEELATALTSQKRGYKVIVVKSTVPIGTAERIENIIKKKKISSKRYEIVSNPEFLREGKAVYDFLHPDRIVIGAENHKSANILSELYRPLNARIIFMDRRSAELVKYSANVFLATRISLINEIANICERVGADIKSVAEGIGYDKRIGNKYLRAGLGFGGSCLPKDVAALIHLAEENGYDARILKGVSKVNQLQRDFFMEKITNILNNVKNKNIAIWGLAFKPQTDDLRDAPSLYLLDCLIKAGAKLKVYDPMVNNKLVNRFPKVKFCKSSYEAAKGSHAIVIATEWNEFREVDFSRLKKTMRSPIIIDGRNIFDRKLMAEEGMKYYGVGGSNT